MGDQEEAASKLGQPAFQPGQPGDIKKVCRLVHQQNIGLFQQNFCQRRPVAPAAGKLFNGPLPVFGTETELGKHGINVPRVFPAALPVHFVQRRRLALQKPLYFACVFIGFQRGGDFGKLGFECLQVGEKGFQSLLHGQHSVQRRKLRKVADFEAPRNLYGSFGRRDLSQDQFEERRLASTVFADQSNALSRLQAEEDRAQHKKLLVLHGDVVEAN